MESSEIKNQLKMTYEELVNYLLKKYGSAQYDYFCNEACKSKNKKVSRTDEGLYCHHIDENKAILLCNDRYAIKNPFEYRKAARLVYCNILEHLILHIKIAEETKNKDCILGVGGICFICSQINDYFNGYEFKQQYLINIFSLIKYNFDDYIDILRYSLNTINEKNACGGIITKKELSMGWKSKIVRKVYEKL